MSKIHLALEDTDLFNCLKGIINHPNGDEIAKVLTYSIGPSPEASTLFFKTYFGDVAPEILPPGTLLKVKADNLAWGIDIAKMKADALLDANGNATVIVKEFRSFHDLSTYYITYTELDIQNNPQEKTGFLNYRDIIEIIHDL
jgi:hypothetical protein